MCLVGSQITPLTGLDGLLPGDPFLVGLAEIELLGANVQEPPHPAGGGQLFVSPVPGFGPHELLLQVLVMFQTAS